MNRHLRATQEQTSKPLVKQAVAIYLAVDNRCSAQTRCIRMRFI